MRRRKRSARNRKRILIGFIILVIIIIIVIIIPLFVAIGTSLKWFPMKTGNNVWVGFWGSYLGSILGFGGIIMTIFYTNKQTHEDRRLQFVPVLKVEAVDESKNKINWHISILDSDDECVDFFIVLKNIGLGPMLNLSINDCLFRFYSHEDKEEPSFSVEDEYWVECIEKADEAVIRLTVSMRRLEEQKTEFAVQLNKIFDLAFLNFECDFHDLMGYTYKYSIDIRVCGSGNEKVKLRLNYKLINAHRTVEKYI